MGAESIEFRIDKKASRSEINDKFRSQQDSDSEYNGSCDGYSGDFQTVREVKDHTHVGVFVNYREAQKYCLDNAEKWVYAIAVYYYETPDTKPLKSELKIKSQLETLTTELATLKFTTFEVKAMHKCSSCGSVINTQIRSHKTCPVCNQSLRPKSLSSKVNSLEGRIKTLQAKLKTLRDERENKALEKMKKSSNPPIKTLVCGWGAC